MARKQYKIKTACPQCGCTELTVLTPEEIKALKERKRLKDEAKKELQRLEARIAELKKI